MIPKIERIEKELKELEGKGQTAKAIHVGLDLYNELNPVYIAPPHGEEQILPSGVEEYNGIPVILIENVPNDYLKILI